jgi:hypothetical protein
VGNGEGANGEGANNTTSEGRNWFDLLIVVAALVALIVALGIVVRVYQNSKDAAAILGIIAPAIATIAAAVFGVVVGQRPGKAKTRTARDLKPQVDGLSDTLQSVFGEIGKLHSPPGDRLLTLRGTPEDTQLTIDPEQLASAQQQLGQIQQGLNSIAR